MEVLITFIVLTFLFVVFIAVFLSDSPEGARERNAERKSKLQQTFSSLSIGTTFLVVADRFRDCEAISSPILVSEVLLENGVNRKIYLWHLDWEYVVSKSSGVGVMPIQTSTFNAGGNGISFGNGTATSFSSGQTTRKAFIQMVFENDKLVAKEQQGLYE